MIFDNVPTKVSKGAKLEDVCVECIENYFKPLDADTVCAIILMTRMEKYHNKKVKILDYSGSYTVHV